MGKKDKSASRHAGLSIVVELDEGDEKPQAADVVDVQPNEKQRPAWFWVAVVGIVGGTIIVLAIAIAVPMSIRPQNEAGESGPTVPLAPTVATVAPNTAPPIVSEAPVTPLPVANIPNTTSPITSSPVTRMPATSSPITKSPTTVAPVIVPHTSLWVNSDLRLKRKVLREPERKRAREKKTGTEAGVSTLRVRLLNERGGVMPSRRAPAEG